MPPAHDIFHVIPEDEQGPHIADEMEPARVQEHISEQRDDRQDHRAIIKVVQEVAGRKAEEVNGRQQMGTQRMLK